ncbi:rhodanese-like domain-containing protein [Glutamicibacter sp. AOP5-A2-7]
MQARNHHRRAADQLLDVREDFEVAEAIISGALRIPMGELDLSRPVNVICRSGNRSARVAEALTAAGYTADTMGGGLTARQLAGTLRPHRPHPPPPTRQGLPT